jgi:hypothetical protein
MRLLQWLLGGLLLGGPLLAHAQKKPITLSWLPTSFLEMDAGITVGAEYRLNKRLALLSDVGLIFYGDPGDASELTAGQANTRNGLLGYKLKPELRWYFKKHSKKPYNGGFMALEGLYKHVTYHRFDGIRVFDNLGNPAYTYLGGYRIIKDVYGVSIKFGYRNFWGPTYKFGIETYVGFGARHKNFATRGLPPGGSFDRAFFGPQRFNTYWREGGLPNFPLGVKLLWRIR